MSDDTHDDMPEEALAILAAEWNSTHRRMCLPPAVLKGEREALLRPLDIPRTPAAEPGEVSVANRSESG